jgi:SSS family solute:Na+ symporter
MAIGTPQIIFGIYLVLFLVLGVIASRYTEHTPDDFYIMGRTVGPILLAMTLLGSILSAFTFFGIGAVASGTGLGTFSFISISLVLYAGILFPTVGVTLYIIGSRMDVLTPSEYLRERYDSKHLGVVYLVVCSLFFIPIIGAQLIGGGVAMDTLLGIPFEWAVLSIGIIMIVYLHLAGYRGIVWSDAIQGTILGLVLIGVFVYALATIGGSTLAGDALADTPDLFSTMGPAGLWTPLFVVTYAIAWAFGVPGAPYSIQRFFSANSPRVVRNSSYLYLLLATPLMLIASTLGIWATGIVAEPPNPDYLIPLLVDELTNPIIFGIAMSGGAAAIMSTTDSIALSLSSMFSRDVYKEYVDPEMSDQKEVRVTQGFIYLMVGLGMGLAFVQPAGIFDLVSIGYIGIGTTTAPIFLGSVWDRSTMEASYVSVIGGPLIVSLLYFDVIPGSLTFGMHYGFIGLLAAYALFVGVTYATTVPTDVDVTSYTHRFWAE